MLVMLGWWATSQRPHELGWTHGARRRGHALFAEPLRAMVRKGFEIPSRRRARPIEERRVMVEEEAARWALGRGGFRRIDQESRRLVGRFLRMCEEQARIGPDPAHGRDSRLQNALKLGWR